MVFVKACIALDVYKVTSKTLHIWRDSGRERHLKNPSGSYLYWVDELPVKHEHTQESESIVYARVSSAKQKRELTNQINLLHGLYPTHRIVSDIGSGINHKRKGFQAILDLLFRGRIKEVVVAHQDRFSRLGFDLFESIFERFGAKLRVVDSSVIHSQDEDLARDIIEIITVFSTRYHGRRPYINENKVLSQSESEDVFDKGIGRVKKALQRGN